MSKFIWYHIDSWYHLNTTPVHRECRCHIIHRYNTSHPKNRPRLSRDNKIDDISLNTHSNRFKFKPHINSMYIHTCGKKSTSNYALK